MQRALITGAAGFSGRHLATMLTTAGNEVVGAGHGTAAGPWSRYATVDMRSATAVRNLIEDVRPEVVFHLAGRLRGTEAELQAHNTAATEHLCSALTAVAPRARLVLAGASAEYGPGRDCGTPFDEGSPCAPSLPYGKSKLAATRHALAVAERTGLDVRVARPSNLLGGGLSTQVVAGSLVAQLAECALHGRPFVVRTGDLRTMRDFVDIEDVCRGYVALARYQGPGRIFNLAAGICHPIRTIVDILQHEVRAPIEVQREPGLVQTGAVDRVELTAAAATSAFGFCTRVSLRESIARMWQTASDAMAAELAS